MSERSIQTNRILTVSGVAVVAVVVVAAFSIFSPMLIGCRLAGEAVEEVPRSIKESSRVQDVSKWQGTYVFSECAPSASASSATPLCWTYQVVVNGDSMGTLRADGPELSFHVNVKPREKEETLRLGLESYIDGDPGRPVWQLGPLNKQGFDKGEVLAIIGRDRAGRMCFAFAAFESKLKSKMVCNNPQTATTTAAPPPSPKAEGAP